MKEIKSKCIIIAYLTTCLQLFINIVFTPLLINNLGKHEYGLYQTVSSFANNLSIINFGIATIISRNIIKYRLENNKKKLQNFLFLGTVITGIISFLVFIFGLLLGSQLEVLYGNLDSRDLNIAKIMYIYIVFNMVIMVWNNMFSGISIGYEKIIVSNGLKLFRQILRILFLIILLLLNLDALFIIQTDLLISILLVSAEMIFCFKKLKIIIKYHYYDKIASREIFLFSLASLLQVVTNNINLNLDKTLLGIMLSTDIVTLYSPLLLIIGTLVTILQVISSLYLPEATKLVLEKADGEAFTDFVINPGRIQSIIGSIIVIGFLFYGKNFLILWLGREFEEIWFATVIVLIPTMIAYVTCVANIIIDAMLKKLARSTILIITAILNIIVTITLVPKIGYLGAALGTSISIILGNIILLNYYYKKIIKLNVRRMYKEIFSGIFSSALIAGGISYILTIFLDNSLVSFVVKGFLLLGVYFICLFKFGLNNQEKSFLMQFRNKIIN